MANPYTHTSLGTAIAAVRTRLQDPNAVQWSDLKLQLYIYEAVRTLQALTRYYRDRDTLATSASTLFYNLNALPTLTNTVTDTLVQALINYHFLEPTTNPYSGTDQFSGTQILSAMQRRRDQFLVDTGSVITVPSPISAPATASRVTLPDSVIDIRRAAWRAGSGGDYQTLWREDEYGAKSYLINWLTPSTIPSGFSVALTPPVSLQLIPLVSVNGSVYLLTVSSGPALGTSTAGGIVLGIPDDFYWGVKFGVMSDLLSQDGQAKDELRADYCEKRYQECVQACRLNPTLFNASIGSGELFIDGLRNMDAYSPLWPTVTPGTPQAMAMCGQNIVAFNPIASGIINVTLDLAILVPLPATSGDYLPVGREALEPLYDYVVHLASFELGGADFAATYPLYQNFINLVKLQNSRLRAVQFYEGPLSDPARKQDILMPRVESTR